MVTQFFGFAEDPFSVTSDARFFYNSEGHEEALSHLFYGLEQRKGFIVLTGEVGAGKTTLLNAMLDKMNANWRHAFIYNSKINFIELLRFILLDFGQKEPPENKVECIKLLNEYLLQCAKEGVDVVIVIDEAQNLTEDTLEEIRLLSNLEAYSRKLIQIVFAGQPEFNSIINSPKLQQLNQRVAIRYHLGALSSNETAEYMKHRLQVAGWKGAEIFNNDAVKLVYRASRGIPRLINQICSVALLRCALSSKRRVTTDIVRKVLDSEFKTHSEVSAGLLSGMGKAEATLAWKWVSAGLALLLLATCGAIAWTWQSTVGDSKSEAERALLEPPPPELSLSAEEPADKTVDTLQGVQSPTGAEDVQPNGESIPEPHGDVARFTAFRPALRTSVSVQSGTAKLGTAPSTLEATTALVKVVAGQSISEILLAQRGISNWELVKEVMRLNPSLQDPDLIPSGMSLRIPLPSYAPQGEVRP